MPSDPLVNVNMQGVSSADLAEARFVRGTLLTATAIQHFKRPELEVLQHNLRLGTKWGVFEIPKEWAPPGSLRTAAARTVDLYKEFTPVAASGADLELAVLTAMRYSIVLFLLPAGVERSFGKHLSLTVVLKSLRETFGQLLKLALQRPPGTTAGLLSRLGLDESGKPTARQRPRLLAEHARIQMLTNRGVWSDAPRPLAPALAETAANRVKKAEPVVAPPEPKTTQYLPLPDPFVAEAGWRLLWMVEQLGPALLEMGRRVSAIYEAFPLVQDSEKNRAREHRRKAFKKLSREFEWKNPAGEPIDALPFEHNLKIGRGGELTWPPENPASIVRLLGLLQISHAFIVLLATGGRLSETLSLAPGCLGDDADNATSLTGKTFKLILQGEGEEREWPIPTVAATAIRHQFELRDIFVRLRAQALEPHEIEGESIWVAQRTGSDTPLLSGGMESMVDALHLRDVLGTVRAHPHRFRKTIARLAALALVGAPKILMDLFGHRTIEMTLNYILTDPELRLEIAEVARAQTVMLAENALRNAETNGGPAAASLLSALNAEKAMHAGRFGQQHLHDFAMALTDGGRSWALVRDGVICTKGSSQYAPCSKRIGRAEPSRCRATCSNRLEDAALRDDVDRAIGEAVQNLETAVRASDEYAAEMWRGQVLANISRFEPLREKWSRNPTVAALVAG